MSWPLWMFLIVFVIFIHKKIWWIRLVDLGNFLSLSGDEAMHGSVLSKLLSSCHHKVCEEGWEHNTCGALKTCVFLFKRYLMDTFMVHLSILYIYIYILGSKVWALYTSIKDNKSIIVIHCCISACHLTTNFLPDNKDVTWHSGPCLGPFAMVQRHSVR